SNAARTKRDSGGHVRGVQLAGVTYSVETLTTLFRATPLPAAPFLSRSDGNLHIRRKLQPAPEQSASSGTTPGHYDPHRFHDLAPYPPEQGSSPVRMSTQPKRLPRRSEAAARKGRPVREVFLPVRVIPD